MSTTVTEIYCVKCKAKKPAKNISEVTFKNGRPALKGICTVCGTNVVQFVSKK